MKRTNANWETKSGDGGGEIWGGFGSFRRDLGSASWLGNRLCGWRNRTKLGGNERRARNRDESATSGWERVGKRTVGILPPFERITGWYGAQTTCISACCVDMAQTVNNGGWNSSHVVVIWRGKIWAAVLEKKFASEVKNVVGMDPLGYTRGCGVVYGQFLPIWGGKNQKKVRKLRQNSASFCGKNGIFFANWAFN